MTWWQILALTVIAVVVVGGYALSEDRMLWSFTGALLGLMAGALIVIIPLAIDQQNRWEAWCRSQGGHVTSHTSVSTTTVVGANGKPGVGTSTDTTYYCLSADGRILDIQ